MTISQDQLLGHWQGIELDDESKGFSSDYGEYRLGLWIEENGEKAFQYSYSYETNHGYDQWQEHGIFELDGNKLLLNVRTCRKRNYEDTYDYKYDKTREYNTEKKEYMQNFTVKWHDKGYWQIDCSDSLYLRKYP